MCVWKRIPATSFCGGGDHAEERSIVRCAGSSGEIKSRSFNLL